MLKTVCGIMAMTISSIAFCQSPGNVSSNLRWWLKANVGVYTNNGTVVATDGDFVQQWNDQSPIGNHARQTTNANKPIFETNQINGNAALHFTGNDFITALAAPGINSTQSFYFFLVIRQDSYLPDGGMNDGNGTFIVDRATENDNLMSLKIVDSDNFGYQKRSNSGANLEGPQSATSAPVNVFSIVTFFREFGSSYGIFLDGRLDASITSNASDPITGPVIQLGRHAVNANQGLTGDIAEAIVYNTTLTTAERRRIESYLAIKYGITLDQSTLTDYVRSNGGVVYPVASTASFGNYRYDIAGIGRDNNSGLIQSASESQNTNHVLRIHNPSSLGNNDFLMWGSNNGSLSSPNATDVDGVLIERRLSRVWRIAETNNVGNVSVTFDLSAVPGAKVGSDLRLLIDRDGDGFDDNDIAPRTGTLSGSEFTVTGVNLNHGDYVTVGTINSSSTPLPVELLSFEVFKEDELVIAEWRTATEQNNDFFVLQRSADGSTWEPVDTVEGNGNSMSLHVYECIDPDPFPGLSYYRIKQTDYNGTFAYSPVRSLYNDSEKYADSFFPNPIRGKTIYLKCRQSLPPETMIRVYGPAANKTYTFPARKSRRGRNIYAFDLTEKLPAGIYVVRITYGNTTDSQLILINQPY